MATRSAGYVLGVDLGTTYTAAAVGAGGEADVFDLGDRNAAIPSVVLLRSDEEVLVGDAAERRGLSESSRVAREFKRRLGDPIPLLLGGTPYGAEALMAHLLKAVVAKVTEQEGGPPSLVVISHPANYGPYKKDLLAEAVRQADVGPVSFVTEPEAAAMQYARLERLEPGEVVAVYDFGGGTFDAAVLRKTVSGFELVGTPEGMERLGGIDFDHAVFAHVDAALGGKIAELDPTDSTATSAVARLRDECRAAKEALSSDTDATIAVLLPNVQTEIRVTRPEFEAVIRPRIAETIATLERAVRSAGLGFDDVSRVLLVGGSSRIPLVGQMVREATGRPVAVDTHPKFAIALGAAVAGMAELGMVPPAEEPTVATPVVEVPQPVAAVAVAAPVAATPAAALFTPAAAPDAAPSAAAEPKSRKGLVTTVLLALAILGLGVVVLTQTGKDNDATITLTSDGEAVTTTAPGAEGEEGVVDEAGDAEATAEEVANGEEPSTETTRAPRSGSTSGSSTTGATTGGGGTAASGGEGSSSTGGGESAGSGGGGGGESAGTGAAPTTTAPAGSGGGTATTAAPATTAPAAVRPIVFERSGKVWKANPDGSGATELAAGGQPALSPDGTKVLVVKGEVGRTNVFVVGINGGAVTRLTDEPTHCGQADWSPDGTQVAFYRYGEIYVINADGTGIRKVLSKPAGRTESFPDWSPDGSKIVFHSSHDQASDGPTDLWVVAAAGGTPTRLTTTSSAQIPSWHPDGSKILFHYSSGLATVPAAGGSISGITTGGATGTKTFGQWSPDGSKVVYMLNNADLWSYPIGGTASFVTNGREPDWR